MTKRRRYSWILSLIAVAAILAVLSPRIARGYWSVRASNPVRRGVARAAELGCFGCHGPLGTSGIPDPGRSDGEVPSWSGGVWMMYVHDDDDIRNYILYGEREKPDDGTHSHGAGDDGEGAIHMPAYESVLGPRDTEDLVAAFKVLSGMSLPPRDSAARRGYDLARKWRCFSCHGPGGSGGRTNPGSFAGFVPGWYGPDFRDLVRSREEFDDWIRTGSIPRLAGNPFASFFMRRQRVPMPAYENLDSQDRDDLWAYVQWLDETGGGTRGGAEPW